MDIPGGVIEALRDQAIGLRTAEPTGSQSDLEGLRTVFAGARLVGLGEATHGTHEFFSLKSRLVRFLVSEMGFRTFALEANWPECELVNRYVLTGEGDPRALLGGLRFWTWYTEEVLELIRWMREYNEAHGDSPVRFRGFDMQHTYFARATVLSFLESADPAAERQARPLYHEIGELVGEQAEPEYDRAASRASAQATSARLAALPRGYQRKLQRRLAAVTRGLEVQRHRYAAAAGVEAHEIALQSARLVELGFRTYRALPRPGNGRFGRAVQVARLVWQTRMGRREPTGRDAAMAANVAWLLQREPAGEKAVLWAHNAHLMSRPPFMGQELRKRFGPTYVAVGLTFGRGQFVARTVGGKAQSLADLGPPSVCDAPAILEGSFEDVCQQAGLELAAVDLRRAPLPLASWLRKNRRMRHFGAGFVPTLPGAAYSVSVELPKAFDVMVYVDKATAARSLPPPS